MKLGTYIVLKLTKPGSGRRVVRAPFIVFRCDECSAIQSRKFSDIRSDLHFCNRSCADKNRSRGKQTRARIESKRQKNDPGLKKATTKRKATCVERYGSDQWKDVPEIVEKISSSTKKSMSEFGLETAIKGLQAKYGPNIVSSLQVFEVREKAKQTCRIRYGCDHHSQTQNNRDRQSLRAIQLAQRGKKTISLIENEFADLLSQLGLPFERQVLVRGRLIDFKLDDKTYIQFDGVYWHGLDRPIDELKSRSGLQAESIYKRFLIDRQQDETFSRLRIKLIRVTDREFRRAQRMNCTTELLVQKGIINGNR